MFSKFSALSIRYSSELKNTFKKYDIVVCSEKVRRVLLHHALVWEETSFKVITDDLGYREEHDAFVKAAS